jgi:streptogramin lyase
MAGVISVGTALTLAACTPTTSTPTTTTTVPGPGADVTTLAGRPGSFGNEDGPGALARLNGPTLPATDSAGNIYVADEGSYTIRKVTPAGVVSTYAGNGTRGNDDGPAASAEFFDPFAVAVDPSGNVFVAEHQLSRIRKITPAGVVSTFVGASSYGFTDGTGLAAQFSDPSGMTTDAAGNLYVADYFNDAIRKVTPAGVVTTVVAENGLSLPTDVKLDAAGNLVVANWGNNTIARVTLAGAVSILAGISGATGHADGPGTTASFNDPYGIVLDHSDNVYVADFSNDTIRKVTPAGVVSTFAGFPLVAGTTDGHGTYARFDGPIGITIDAYGTLYVSDFTGCTIRRIRP